MDMNYFPDKDTLIDLVGNINRNLRIKARKEEKTTEMIIHLLQNRYKIFVRKVDDQYQGRWIDLIFCASKETDTVSPRVWEEHFSLKENYTEEELEIGLPDRDHYLFVQSLYDKVVFPEIHGLPVPDFILTIPCFLLNAPTQFIIDYLMDRYFRGERFNGLRYQKGIGKLRVRAMSNETREGLKRQLQTIGTRENEKIKGKLIGECFRLLGFEVLVIDELKETSTYSKLKELKDVDVIAISYATQGLILIEEKPKFKTDDYLKLEALHSMLKIFPFLGKAQHWRVSYLIVARTAGIIQAEITEIAENKNVIFWTPDKFRKTFLPLFDFTITTERRINWSWEDLASSNVAPNYDSIYDDIMYKLLGKAKRPIFEYK